MTHNQHAEVNGLKATRQNFHLQFLTTPSADTRGQTAILHFDDQRYLFGNLSEGTQRALIQRGVSIRKMNNAFITGQTTWASNGGLIGFILSRADIPGDDIDQTTGKRTRMSIYGGPKLMHSIACARRFVFRTGMPLAIHELPAQSEWSNEPSFVDDNIRVWPIVLSAHSKPEKDPNCNPSSVDESSTESNGLSTKYHSLKMEEDQDARRRILQDMFDSEWRRDRLIKTPFKDVKMPATVWVKNQTTKDLEAFHCATMEDAPQLLPDHIVQVRNPWPASLVGDLPPASNLPSDVALSYIVRGYPQRGSFDVKKAKALGVTPGPLYGELTQGNSVTLPNGATVSSEEVMTPSRPGRGVAFFDLPSPQYLYGLVRVLENHSDALEDIVVVVWTLGHGVSSCDAWHDLLQSLGDMQHFITDADRLKNDLAFESLALMNARLSRIAPRHFRAVDHSPVIADGSPELQRNLQSVIPGTRVSIEPKYAIDKTDAAPSIDPEKTVQQELSQRKQTSSEHSPVDRGPLFSSESPEIVTLGTGSALPSKYRNVSATLLRRPKGGSYLFDCGENTLGQLKRMYGSDNCDEILRDIRTIWISHLHADHHLGTISVLQERARAFDRLNDVKADRTVYLISEANMIDFVREYATVENSLLSTSGLIPLVSSDHHGLTLDGKPFDIASNTQDIQNVRSCRVSHCWGAQAVTFTFKSGFKISYSGDCRPSRYFCKIGRNSDVLIHEATFDNDMEGDAMAKKHCTTSEALGVALKMRAKNVILTHFSQRYSKIPNLENLKLPDEIKYEEVSKTAEPGPIDNDGQDSNHRSASPAPSNTSSESLAATEGRKVGPLSSDSDDMAEIYSIGQQLSRNERRQRQTAKAAQKMHVCVAFDYMRVRVNEIKDMKQYYPAIESMFEEQEGLKEEKRKARADAQSAVVREREERRTKKLEEAKQKQIAASEERRKAKGEKKAKARMENGRRADEVMQKTTTAAVAAEEEEAPPPPSTLSSPAIDLSSAVLEDAASDAQGSSNARQPAPATGSEQDESAVPNPITPQKRPLSPTTESLQSGPRDRQLAQGAGSL